MLNEVLNEVLMALEDHVKVVDLELHPGHKLTLCLFVNVLNAAELHSKVQCFDASFINAEMVRELDRCRFGH